MKALLIRWCDYFPLYDLNNMISHYLAPFYQLNYAN